MMVGANDDKWFSLSGSGKGRNGNDGGNGGANTGGGGGGSGCQMNGTADAIGANGGSGIVVVRYPSIYEAATVTGSSVAQSVSGGYRIYQFLASGSISW